jgi:Zn-dependent M28 family amino/carboxypeptidase
MAKPATFCRNWSRLVYLAPPVLVLVISSLACSRQKSTADAAAKAPVSADAVSADSTPAVPEDNGPLPAINAARAFQYTKEVTAFGPRPIGSANHKKLEDYIYSHLKGDDVVDDVFTADTPEGKFPARNIIARYPGTRDGIVVIAGHYDTPYNLRSTPFVGANDGGSSTAILLEFANQFRGKKRDGYSVWLVWTDAEEAVKQWSATDSLYGTRQLADAWQKDGTLGKVKSYLLVDMIGDADLSIDRDQNSTPWLLNLISQAANRYGYQSHFFSRTTAIEDDHLPFVRKGIASADIIDLDYGYGNAFHHTPQDTMDKLSPKSFQIVGDTVLETVHILDAMQNLPPAQPANRVNQ